jgi:hypothetical protein
MNRNTLNLSQILLLILNGDYILEEQIKYKTVEYLMLLDKDTLQLTSKLITGF